VRHGNIQFIDALYGRAEEIKTISVHHETVAGFMADVYYRVSGQPTATFTSCGPGSANLPIALGNSFLDSVPFLAVTGNIPTSSSTAARSRSCTVTTRPTFPSTVRAYCKRVFQPTARDGAARDTPGVEDHGDRAARPGGARRAGRREVVGWVDGGGETQALR